MIMNGKQDDLLRSRPWPTWRHISEESGKNQDNMRPIEYSKQVPK